jgi:hypothetical protein
VQSSCVCRCPFVSPFAPPPPTPALQLAAMAKLAAESPTATRGKLRGRVRFSRPPKLPGIVLPTPQLGCRGRVQRLCRNPTCGRGFLSRTRRSRNVFSGMAAYCSAKCASAAIGVNVVPMPRSPPVVAPAVRVQAPYLAAARILDGAGTRLAEVGSSSFAAAAVMPDGRVATAVKVGTSQPENPGQRRLNLLTAIVAAALIDPQRIHAAIARRDAERRVDAAGGAAKMVAALPESALAGIEVRPVP